MGEGVLCKGMFDPSTPLVPSTPMSLKVESHFIIICVLGGFTTGKIMRTLK